MAGSAPVATAAIGEEVKLFLQDGTIFAGTVFSYDRKMDCIVLEEPHPQSTLKKDVRIVKLSLVKKVESVNPAPSPEAIPKLPVLTVGMAQEREKEALRKAKEELAKIGKGVTAQAQELFDILSKTYQLRWNGKKIESTQLGIVISPPYGPGDCMGTDQMALNRIRQIVKTINERKQ